MCLAPSDIAQSCVINPGGTLALQVSFGLVNVSRNQKLTSEGLLDSAESVLE